MLQNLRTPLWRVPDMLAVALIIFAFVAGSTAVNVSDTNSENRLLDLAGGVDLAAAAAAQAAGGGEVQGQDLESMLHWAIGQ